MSIANRILQVVVSLGLVLLTFLPCAWAQHHKEQVIGTWKLISLEYRRSDGEVFYPMGPGAVGWITYTADGRMAVQIMKPDRPRFGTSDLLGGTAEEKRSAYEGYIAYLGAYTVDENEGFIVHYVEGSLFPNWIGTAQKRFFTVQGSRLLLKSAPFMARGGEIVAHVIWERLH
jgi:Lipocalin-like domain